MYLNIFKIQDVRRFTSFVRRDISIMSNTKKMNRFSMICNIAFILYSLTNLFRFFEIKIV